MHVSQWKMFPKIEDVFPKGRYHIVYPNGKYFKTEKYSPVEDASPMEDVSSASFFVSSSMLVSLTFLGTVTFLQLLIKSSMFSYSLLSCGVTLPDSVAFWSAFFWGSYSPTFLCGVWIEVGSSHPQPCNNFTSLVKLDWQTTVTSLGNIQTRAQRKGSCGSYSAQPLPYYAMPALLVKHSYYAQYNAASLTVLCTYKCAVCIYCASENDGAIVEPTQLRCDRPHCSILKKTKPFD